MMCIPISVSLLALTAGMFLLAKTRKEDLGKFFNAISYFIIIVSLLIIFLTFIGGFTRMIFHKMRNEERKENWMHMHERESWMREKSGRFEENEREHGRYGEHHGREGEEGYEREHYRHHEEGDERHENWKERHENWKERHERMIERLSEKLNLTPEQVSKVKEIFKNGMQREEAEREKIHGDKEKFEKLRREEHEKGMEGIKKILTPEQLKIFNESRKEGEGMWHSDSE